MSLISKMIGVTETEESRRIEEKRRRERIEKRAAWERRVRIPGLDAKIDAMSFNEGDEIYIQFNPKMKPDLLPFSVSYGHILKQDAIYGRILAAGKDVFFLDDPDYEARKERERKAVLAEARKHWEKSGKKDRLELEQYKSIALCATKELPLALTYGKGPDVMRAWLALYDPHCADSWGIRYSTTDGQRLLIEGFGLNTGHVGFEDVAMPQEFEKLEPKHLANQILIHTNYLKAVNADVFLNEDIPRGMQMHERQHYIDVARKLNKESKKK